MADFGNDAASYARKAGMMAGGKAGLAASSAVMGAFTVAAPPLAIVLGLPILGAWLGWKAVEAVTKGADS